MANGWTITTTGRGDPWLVKHFGDGAVVVAHATSCGYRVSWQRDINKYDIRYFIERVRDTPGRWHVEREFLGVFDRTDDVVNMLRLLLSAQPSEEDEDDL
jgi:hypothetical protein